MKPIIHNIMSDQQARMCQGAVTLVIEWTSHCGLLRTPQHSCERELMQIEVYPTMRLKLKCGDKGMTGCCHRYCYCTVGGVHTLSCMVAWWFQFSYKHHACRTSMLIFAHLHVTHRLGVSYMIGRACKLCFLTHRISSCAQVSKPILLKHLGCSYIAIQVPQSTIVSRKEGNNMKLLCKSEQRSQPCCNSVVVTFVYPILEESRTPQIHMIH